MDFEDFVHAMVFYKSKGSKDKLRVLCVCTSHPSTATLLLPGCWCGVLQIQAREQQRQQHMRLGYTALMLCCSQDDEMAMLRRYHQWCGHTYRSEEMVRVVGPEARRRTAPHRTAPHELAVLPPPSHHSHKRARTAR